MEDKRVLSVGKKLEFADDSVSWDSKYNIQDYSVVFLNIVALDAVYLQSDKPHLLAASTLNTVNLPKQSKVETACKEGTIIYAVLPYHRRIPVDQSAVGLKELDCFRWLPMNLDITEESGSSVNPDSIHEDWDWYFSGEEFNWHLHFKTNQNVRHPSSDRGFISTSIIENRYSRALGLQLKLQSSSGSISSGGIALVPLLSSWTFDELCEGILSNIIFSESSSESNNSVLPEWVSNYKSPGEPELQDEITEIEKEIEELEEGLESKNKVLDEKREYKKLLYGSDNQLEELVPRVFAELGFDTEDEFPHHRDGEVKLDDRTIILETTGTTKGVKREKARQLEEWVEDMQFKNPSENYEGLLVVNPFRREDPKQREGYLSKDVAQYLEKRGHCVMTTAEMFRAYIGYEKGDLSKEEIIEEINSDDTEIRFDRVDWPLEE